MSTLCDYVPSFSPRDASLIDRVFLSCSHGHSVANGKDIILSDKEQGVKPEWGLTDLGSSQAERAGEQMAEILKHEPIGGERIVILSSPFSRAYETAARVGSHLDIHLHDSRFRKVDALAERYFGSELEGKSASLYGGVWEEDEKDITTRPDGGGESVNDVAGRLEQLIYSIEDEFQNHFIILTSHGDSLSILQSVLKNGDKRKHRQYGLLNCEVCRIDPIQ